MKKYIFIIAITLVLASCTKEEPMETSAKFSSSIDGSLQVGESFTIYLGETTGEFLTYFKGDSEETSWESGYGTSIEVGADSLVISAYGAEGTYNFTLVATSYGNWGETVSQDVVTEQISVVSQK